MDKRPVPKFASFKPKEPKSSDHASRGKSNDRAAHLSSGNVSKDSTARGSALHPRRDRGRYDDSDDGHRALSAGSRPELQHCDDGKIPDSFLIDRVGDPKNVQYGSIHRYELSSYRRAGRGCVIGDSTVKIDPQSCHNGHIVLTDARRDLHDHGNTNVLARAKPDLLDPPSHIICMTDAPDLTLSGADFVPFASTSTENRVAVHITKNSDDNVSNLSREERQSMPRDAGRPNQEAVGHTVKSTLPGIDEVTHNAKLQRIVNENPTNAQAWLDLTAHQSNLVRSNAYSAPLTRTELQAVADLRVTILTAALEHFPIGAPGRHCLLLNLLKEGAHVWTRSKTMTQWKLALTGQKHASPLWLFYLDFLQHDHATFQYDECYQAFMNCLRALVDVDGMASPKHSRLRREVILRFSLFIHSAGYTELAFSIWQALLEFHFLMPDSLSKSSLRDQVLALQDFWESETCRIGEKPARGWYRATEPDSMQQRKAVEASRDQPFSLAGSLQKEIQLSQEQWLPSTSTDDETDDPFRYVLFSDLQEIVELTANGFCKSDILDAFVSFLGLPQYFNSETWDGKCDADAILAEASVVSQCCALHTTEGASSVSQWVDIRMQQETVFTLLCPGWFGGSTFTDNCIDAETHSRALFADNVFGLIAEREHNDDALAEYHIALALQIRPSTASKTARSYLYRRNSGLRLPNIYALTEARLGHMDRANRLWLTALRNRKSIPGADEDIVVLWHTAVLFHLHNHDDRAAMGILATVVEDVVENDFPTIEFEESKILQLRIRRELEGGFDRMLLAKHYKNAALFAHCIALLSYMTTHHDLQDALAVHTEYEQKLQERECWSGLELLMQGKAELIKLHLGQRRSYKPRAIADTIAKCAESFPSNSTFSQLQHELAGRDRIRLLFANQAGARRGLVSSMSSIHVSFSALVRDSLEFTSSRGDNIGRMFADNLKSSEGSCSEIPSFWFAWLHFQHACFVAAVSSADRKAAVQSLRQIFFEGLLHIPGIKLWYLKGMAMLKDNLSQQESKQVLNMLHTRGLRIRTAFLNDFDAS